MILAAHQPGYLPDLAFFYKMCHSDIFVIADNLQYSKHSLTNRAKIKTAQGAQWLTVPIITKGRQNQTIGRVQIAHNQNWRHKHWNSLAVNYKYAAFFEKYADFFLALYSHRRHSLLELNMTIIDYFVECFKISTEILLLSNLKVKGKGVELLVNLLKHLNCDEYLCELEFEDYLDAAQFASHDLTVTFFSPPRVFYHQLFGEFVPGLSAVDLLFNEGEDGYKVIYVSR